MAREKNKGGRYTPRGGGPLRLRAQAGRSGSGGAPLGQVGRRPTRPPLLLAIGLLWVGCGVVALVKLHAGWKLIPGVVFIGIGLLYLRAAGTAYLRQAR